MFFVYYIKINLKDLENKKCAKIHKFHISNALS